MEEGDQDGWVRGHGAHSSHKHIKNTSTCGTVLTENQWETGRRSPIQPKLQDRSPGSQIGWGERASGQDLCPLEESVRKKRSTWSGPHSGEPPCLVGNPLEQTEGIEKPKFYLQGVCTCWLANNQGRERLVPGAAALLHFPIRRGKHPGPTRSTPQPGRRSGQRFSLAAHGQITVPGMWSRLTTETIVSAHGSSGWNWADTVSAYTGQCHKNAQQLSAESRVDRLWGRIWSSCAEKTLRAWGIVPPGKLSTQAWQG